MVKTILKRLALLAASAAVVLVPLAGQAASDWGPARQIKTYSPGVAGFDHVQFNSFTGTPSYGDERTFFDGKDATNTGSGGFQDMNTVQDGQELLMRVYVHNGADPSLNGTNFDGPGVAKNTMVRVQLPTGTGRSLRANAFISANNANPGTVFDSADFQTTGAAGFSISYVSGSARISTRGAAEGMQVNDSLVTTGALVGYNQLDGVVPACFQYDLVVSFKVKVNGPSISLKKSITTIGSTDWKPSLDAKVGDEESWLLDYRNTSSAQVDHIVLKDQLPAHLEVTPGSVMLFDSNNPNGMKLSDTGLFTTGVDVGSLGVNGGGYIRFRTKVKSDFGDNECNATLQNNASAQGQGTSEVKASATLVVTKECKTIPQCTVNCTPTPPTTPPLPATGPEGAAAGVFGTGALGYSLRAYLRSKKSLLDALKR